MVDSKPNADYDYLIKFLALGMSLMSLMSLKVYNNICPAAFNLRKDNSVQVFIKINYNSNFFL